MHINHPMYVSSEREYRGSRYHHWCQSLVKIYTLSYITLNRHGTGHCESVKVNVTPLICLKHDVHLRHEVYWPLFAACFAIPTIPTMSALPVTRHTHTHIRVLHGLLTSRQQPPKKSENSFSSRVLVTAAGHSRAIG